MHKELVFFHCLTPLHNGAGQGLGAIDRPIIRESATNYPFIQSSSIKGALLARANSKFPEERKAIDAAFGEGGIEGNRGCVVFTDAILLLFPVRSLAGTFAWVTSRLALHRFNRFAAIAGGHAASLMADANAVINTQIKPNISYGGSASIQLTGGGPFCIENLVLTNDDETRSNAVAAWIGGLAASLFPTAPWKDWLKDRCLLISDDDFSHLIEHATQVEANIEIKETGVTQGGSLRYTEYLPAETILFSYAMIERPLGKDAPGGDVQFAAVKNLYEKLFEDNVLQLGADESKGKGITRAISVESPPPTPPPGNGQPPATNGGKSS